MELANIGKLLGCLKTGVDLTKELISTEKTFKGILIPNGCGKTFLCNNLESTEYHLLDLDNEAYNELDSDDKETLADKDQLAINRVVYTKSKKIITEVIDILVGSSNNSKDLLLLSSDYRLLKYNGCNHITYFMPSEMLVTELRKNQNFNFKKFETCKNDLLKRKCDKLVIYNSMEELAKLVCDKFNCKLKI